MTGLGESIEKPPRQTWADLNWTLIQLFEEDFLLHLQVHGRIAPEWFQGRI